MHPIKNFSDEGVENEHMLVFLRAQMKASQHNDAYAKGEVSFELDAWNFLADLPHTEYTK
jgi:hypothetical protein